MSQAKITIKLKPGAKVYNCRLALAAMVVRFSTDSASHACIHGPHEAVALGPRDRLETIAKAIRNRLYQPTAIPELLEDVQHLYENVESIDIIDL